MSRRGLWIGVGLIVAAALVVLVIAVKWGGGDGEPGPESGKVGGQGQGQGQGSGDGQDGPGADRPRLTGPGGVVIEGQPNPRDHRRNPVPVGDTGGGRPPPTGDKPEHKVQPVSVAAVRLALRPLVERCKASLDPSTLGMDPYLQVVVKVHVSGGKVIVDETEVQLRDVEDPSVADCIRDGAAGLSVGATGHPDVDQATLTHGFKLHEK